MCLRLLTSRWCDRISFVDSALKIKILHIIFFFATPMIKNITIQPWRSDGGGEVCSKGKESHQHWVPRQHRWCEHNSIFLRMVMVDPLMKMVIIQIALTSTAISLMWAHSWRSWWWIFWWSGWCNLYFKSSFCGLQGLGGVCKGVQTHWSAAGRTWIRFFTLRWLSSL